MRFAVLALTALGMASAAHADPCEAPLPKPGSTFGGVVRYIVDGDGFCVGRTDDPSTWVEVRVANFYAPELYGPGGQAAKAVMTKIAFDKRAVCVAGRRSHDRTIATCKVEGWDIGDMMRKAGVSEGGNR